MRIYFAFALMVALPLLADADDKPVTVKLGKLSAPAPAEWKSEKVANRLRSYQFKLPGEKGGPGHAELVIMPESDPKAGKVFPRWKATVVPPEGKTADEVGKTRKLEGVKGAKIDILDCYGTWKYRERPFDPKSKEEMKDDHRVIWVIVNDDDEACHLRLSGPKETVDRYYPGFEKFLKSLK
jgi:hypothetical protein